MVQNHVLKERWLVTGATGQLGRHLLKIWSKTSRSEQSMAALSLGGAVSGGHETIALDLTNFRELTAFLEKYSPNRIVHLAGLARPAEAESDRRRAWALHVETTRILAEYVAANDGWLFFASSDFVLEGTAPGLQDETASVRGDTVYAATKLQGERAVLRAGAGCVGRLSMLWGMPPIDSESPWGSLIARLKQGLPVFGVIDEIRTPLRFDIAARMILSLAEIRDGRRQGFRGTVNIGGSQVCSPYELICQLRDSIATDAAVIPVSRQEYAPNLPRPANAALDTRLLQQLLTDLHQCNPTG